MADLSRSLPRILWTENCADQSDEFCLSFRETGTVLRPTRNTAIATIMHAIPDTRNSSAHGKQAGAEHAVCPLQEEGGQSAPGFARDVPKRIRRTMAITINENRNAVNLLMA
jgi:hypothetical protein